MLANECVLNTVDLTQSPQECGQQPGLKADVVYCPFLIVTSTEPHIMKILMTQLKG